MKLLKKAAKLALGTRQKKNFRLACIAKRKDGVFVSSLNAGISNHPVHAGHAEVRALQKAGADAVLYVARVHKDGSWALAKPCSRCQAFIKNKHVKRVYYTIGPNEWGIWEPQNNIA